MFVEEVGRRDAVPTRNTSGNSLETDVLHGVVARKERLGKPEEGAVALVGEGPLEVGQIRVAALGGVGPEAPLAVVVLVQDHELLVGAREADRRLRGPLGQPEHDVGVVRAVDDVHGRVRREALVQQVAEAPALLVVLLPGAPDVDAQRLLEAQARPLARAARAGGVEEAGFRRRRVDGRCVGRRRCVGGRRRGGDVGLPLAAEPAPEQQPGEHPPRAEHDEPARGASHRFKASTQRSSLRYGTRQHPICASDGKLPGKHSSRPELCGGRRSRRGAARRRGSRRRSTVDGRLRAL